MQIGEEGQSKTDADKTDETESGGMRSRGPNPVQSFKRYDRSRFKLEHLASVCWTKFWPRSAFIRLVCLVYLVCVRRYRYFCLPPKIQISNQPRHVEEV